MGVGHVNRHRHQLEQCPVADRAGADFVLRSFPAADIDKGRDHPGDPIFIRAVRSDPRQVPTRVPELHFALDRRQVPDHLLGVGHESFVIEVARDVGDWPAHIRRNKIEDLLRARREPMDAQLAIKKNGADIGRRHQVVEVGIRPAQLFDVVLELVVDGGKLFVDRLQFLLARLQLFRRGTQLLVHRLELFVGGLQLFVGRFVLLDRGVELLL